MYSNGGIYVPNRKPPLGALLNPYLPTNKGLIGFWLMNEGSGDTTFDLSGNRNAGTLVGTAAWASGRFGPAIILDGNSDYVNVVDSPSFDWGDKITICVWFKTSDKTVQRSLVCKAGGATTREFNLNIQTDGRIRFWASNDGSGVGDLTYSPSVDYADGLWHHAVGMCDGSNRWVYVDGVAGASTVFSGSIYNGTAAIRIGHSEPDPGSWFWNGLIDHVMIVGCTLSSSEIAQLSIEQFCGFRWMSIEQLAAYKAGFAYSQAIIIS